MLLSFLSGRFVDQLEEIFDPNADPPGWDSERRYTTQSIEVRRW